MDDIRLAIEHDGREIPVNIVDWPQKIIPLTDETGRIVSVEMGSECTMGELFELVEDLDKGREV